MLPVVVHLKKSSYDINIGRPSIYGNPWTHLYGTKALFVVENRDIAVGNYRKWLFGTDFCDILQDERKVILESIPLLIGKRLGCWCSPQSCHGDILVELVKDYMNHLREKVENLVDEFRKQTQYTSAPRSMLNTLAAQKLISMGQPIVPILLEIYENKNNARGWNLFIVLQGISHIENLRGNVKDLIDTLHHETMNLSSTRQKRENVAFKTMVSMGQEIVPILLDFYENPPSGTDVPEEPYFNVGEIGLVLQEITKIQPVPEKDFGNTDKIREAWIDWGKNARNTNN